MITIKVDNYKTSKGESESWIFIHNDIGVIATGIIYACTPGEVQLFSCKGCLGSFDIDKISMEKILDKVEEAFFG